MKHLYIRLSVLLFSFSVMTIMSCSEEDDLFGSGKKISESAYELVVTDRGLVLADATPQSLEQENFSLGFENDDALGVIAVNGTKVEHIRFMYKQLLDKWSGDLSAKEAGTKFFAYYPYDEKFDLSKVNVDAVDANDFFSQYIADFVPQTDQSKPENFKKSNLMVSAGVLDVTKQVILFDMTHQMALAMVTVDPTQGVTMSLESDPEYKWEISGISTESLVPFYKVSEQVYGLYMVPDMANTIEIGGGFSGKVIVTGISGGTYQKYDILLEHKLQSGDFYMKDGSILSKNVTLNEKQKSECIGIVFQTDIDRIGQAEKDDLEAKGVKPHGLVVALKNEKESHNASTKRFNWGKIPLDNNKEILAESQTKKDCYDDISGLANCNSIWNKQEINLNDYPALRMAKTYSSQVAVDLQKTTGWFLPSIGQWWDIFRELGECVFLDNERSKTDKGNFSWKPLPDAKKDLAQKMNMQLKKIGGDYVHIFSDRGYDAFWSSSEFSYDYVRNVLFSETEMHIKADSKTVLKDCRVRCVLAF